MTHKGKGRGGAPKAVMDTNVLLSALMSQRGASHRVLAALRDGAWTMALGTHLLLEYEEVLKRNHGRTGLAAHETNDILDALCMAAELHDLAAPWTPRSPDPADDIVMRLAYAAGADYIITYNKRHYLEAGLIGLTVAAPGEFLSVLEKKT
jgi:putative PIN family toxin of toxin-antitoxin system